MSLLTIILASLAALEHLYIFYLESIKTTSDTTKVGFSTWIKKNLLAHL